MHFSGAASETGAEGRRDGLQARAGDDGGMTRARGAERSCLRPVNVPQVRKRKMKVHRKILTHFLSCPSPIDKDGYLYKKKERTGVFRRRWFVLKGNLLFYQERPADRHIQGAIVLEGCRVWTGDSDSDFSLAFYGLRTYRFCAGDRRRREEWVKCLITASHCYMSLLLRDLGLQYQAAKHLQSPESRSPERVDPPCSSASGNLTLTPQQHHHAHRLPPPPASSCCSSGLRPNFKSPKLWAKRNAHVTPIHGPAPASSEWPRVDIDPLLQFSKIHEFYGREVQRARDDWLRLRERAGLEEGRDLIDLF